MEREQIIKALELCVEWHSTDDCYKCPYYVPEGICECAEDDFLLKQSLSLIKELTEENDRLRAELEKRPLRLVITKLQKGNNDENSKDTVTLQEREADHHI